MPRKKKVSKIMIKPDLIFNSLLLSKFVNYIMVCGKKSLAENIVYKALEIVKDKTKVDPIVVFEKALEHIKPIVEVRSRRVGGATYQVPVEVKPKRAITLAMRWLVGSSRIRNEKNMILKLAFEIIEAADDNHSIGNSIGKGGAVKKREDTHRMAEANRAFAHYRW
ncbi:MAG TPA: 30S ribosomal protein S7 [Candidatus Azoamicus sp. OHIO1]